MPRKRITQNKIALIPQESRPVRATNTRLPMVVFRPRYKILGVHSVSSPVQLKIYQPDSPVPYKIINARQAHMLEYRQFLEQELNTWYNAEPHHSRFKFVFQELIRLAARPTINPSIGLTYRAGRIGVNFTINADNFDAAPINDHRYSFSPEHMPSEADPEELSSATALHVTGPKLPITHGVRPRFGTRSPEPRYSATSAAYSPTSPRFTPTPDYTPQSPPVNPYLVSASSILTDQWQLRSNNQLSYLNDTKADVPNVLTPLDNLTQLVTAYNYA
jgi:hypothetical protein